LNSLWCFETVV